MRKAEDGCELQSRKSNVSAAALRSAHIRVAMLSTSYIQPAGFSTSSLDARSHSTHNTAKNANPAEGGTCATFLKGHTLWHSRHNNNSNPHKNNILYF